MLLDRLPGSHLTHEAANQLSAHRETFIFELPDQLSGANSWHLGVPVVNSGHDRLPALLLLHRWFRGLVVDLGPLDVQQLTLPPDRKLTGLLKEAWGLDVQPRESNPEENLAPALTDRWS